MSLDAELANVAFLFSVRPHLAPPPAHKVLRRDIDAKFLQRPRRQVAIIGPLHARAGIVALRIRLHAFERQAHDLREKLTDLVLGVFVFRREL